MFYGLGDPVEYLDLREIFSLFLGGSDAGVHVAGVAVGHDDAEVTVLIGVGVLEADDVGMAEFLEEFEFVLDILSIFLFQFHHFQFFYHIVFAFMFVFALVDLPERPSYTPTYPIPISFPISYKSLLIIVIILTDSLIIYTINYPASFSSHLTPSNY